MVAAPSSRERVRATLGHREPDRIPFDLGGSRMTGIHLRAYAGLRAALGLPEVEVRVGDLTQQPAEVDTDAMDLLGCDGFVFAAVHNVQPNVPPENLVAMWETWREEAAYGRG